MSTYTFEIRQAVPEDAAAIREIYAPYVTNASSHFHERMGYTKVGHYHQCGYKFQQYFDTVVFEKRL